MIATKINTNVPITLAGLKPLCVKWLFPGLLLSLVVGPQPWARPLLIGQMIVFLNDVAATIIVFATFRSKFWLILLISIICLTKLSSFFVPAADILYIVSINILLFLAGTVIAYKSPRLVYKQLMAVCFLSVPFMLMQASGVGGLSQILATEYQGVGTAPEVGYTVFVPLDDLLYDVRVFRPAGLLRSGTLVSLVVLFAVPLHISGGTERLPLGTATLSMMAVLSMSKIVFLGLIVITLFILLTGNSKQRREVLKMTGFTLFFLYLYSWFFPGLISHNLSSTTISYSFFVRLNDIVDLFPKDSLLREMLDPYLEGTFRYTSLREDGIIENTPLSGIPALIPLLPYIFPFLVVLIFLFYRGYKIMRSELPERIFMCLPVLTGLLIYPAVFPIWETGLFWFMMSFALLPIMFILIPKYFGYYARRNQKIELMLKRGY